MNNEQIVRALSELYSAIFDLSGILGSEGQKSQEWKAVKVALREAQDAIHRLRLEARAGAETEDGDHAHP